MSNTAVVKLLAQRLPAGLMHPGDNQTGPKLIPLPGLATTGIPPEMAKHFAQEAGLPHADVPQLIAEAVVALIEGEAGCTIIPNTELAQLRADAATVDTNPAGPVAQICCRCNRTHPLLEIAVSRPKILIDAPILSQRIRDICTCPTSE